MRKLIYKHGFDVFLIDAYGASRHCLRCFQPSLQTVKYTNLNCLKKTDGSEDRNRLWNRELTAVLNFWHILNRLRYNSIIPEKFTRVIQIGRIRRSSGGSSFETKTD
ncbi:hypothetical protein F4703DRAFT_1316379 [Phycomyces blakesleeanus]